MMKAYRGFWKGYIDFSGKTSRKDFWLAMLAVTIVSTIILIPASRLGPKPLMIISSFYMVAVMIPTVAILARRLNDAGKSLRHLLWLLLPVYGWFVLLYFACKPTAAQAPSVTRPAGAVRNPQPARTVAAPQQPRPAAAASGVQRTASAGTQQAGIHDVIAYRNYMLMADQYAHEENLFAENPKKKQLEAQLLAGGTDAQQAITGYLTLCGAGKIPYGWWNGAAGLTLMIRKINPQTAETCLNLLKDMTTNIWEYHTQIKETAEKELLELKKASGTYAADGRIPAAFAHAELLQLQNLNPPVKRLEKVFAIQDSVDAWSNADKAFYYFIAGGAARVLYPDSDAKIAFYAAQVFCDPAPTSMGWDHLRAKEGSSLSATPENARMLHEKYPLPKTMEEAAHYSPAAAPAAAVPSPQPSAGYTLDDGMRDLTALFASFPNLNTAAIQAVGQRIYDANIPLVSGVGGMHQLYMLFKQRMPGFAPHLSRIWDGIGDWAD